MHRGSPQSCLIHHPRSVRSQHHVPGRYLRQQAAPPARRPQGGRKGSGAETCGKALVGSAHAWGGVAQSYSCTKGVFLTQPPAFSLSPLPAESPNTERSLPCLARLGAQGWGMDPTGTQECTPASEARWQSPHWLSVAKSSSQETGAPGEGCRAGAGPWGKGGYRRGVQTGFPETLTPPLGRTLGSS